MRLLYALTHFTITATLLLGLASRTQAQSVGIGTATPNPKAALDISASDKGLLIPRMDSATRAQITAPPDGLMVFQANGRKGFWYAIGGIWVFIPDKTKSGDNLGSHSATQNLNLNGHQLTGGGANGLSVTNNGRVGIGTVSPTGLLQIATTQLAAETVDQQQVLTSGGSFSSTLTLAWQSFTPAISGTLTRLEIFMNSPTTPTAATATLKIYAGEGTSGTVLTTQPLSISPVSTYQSVTLLTAVPLVAGQKYTFHVLPTVVNQLWLSVFTTNPYAGGRSGLQSNADLRFRTFVRAEMPYDALTVLPSGEVGIGTSAPLAPLDINGTTRTTNLQVTAGAASGQVLTSDATGNATWQAVPSSADNLGNHMATQPLNLAQQELRLRSATDANHALFHAETWNGIPLDGPVLTGYGGGQLGLNRNGTLTSVLRWSSTGLVGIGTTGPAARLHVSGAETSSNGRNAAFRLENTAATTPNSWIFRAGGAGTSTPDGGFSISDDNNYRLTITSTGNVGIGTTNPAQKLDVNGNVRVTGLGGTGERMLVADAEGDVRPSRYYSATGNNVTAGTAITHTITHNMGYEPLWLISLESSESLPSFTVTFENISNTQTRFRVYNAGIGPKSYQLHAFPVR